MNPTTYRPEVGLAIAAGVAHGASLRELRRSQPFHVPEPRQVARWAALSPPFERALHAARITKALQPREREQRLERALAAWTAELER